MKRKYFLIIIVLGFFSCQKKISDSFASLAEVDVYVAGFMADSAVSDYLYYSGTDEHPTYWKNGSPVQLNYDDVHGQLYYGINVARALSIAVSGNNVYTAGYGIWFSPTKGHLPYGMFWKNSIPLDEDSMNIYDTYYLKTLAVSNNDTYMVGWGEPFNDATYWKNESRIDLQASSSAESISVSGNDVYVAGESIVNGVAIATYWKNGNPANLTDGSNDTYTTSIAVSRADVFVAGYDKDSVAKYWKNGTLVNLTDGSTGAEANSIAISGTDVYVAGTQWDGNLIQNINGYVYRTPIAKYWKNGNPVKLTDGSKWAEATSIAISGTDVYVAGFEDGVAKYWKNGNPVILGDVSKYSEAYSIFLAKK